MAPQPKKNLTTNMKISPSAQQNTASAKQATSSSAENNARAASNNSAAFSFNAKNPLEQWSQFSEATSSYINNSTSLFTGNAEAILACTNTALKSAESFVCQCIEYSNNLFADNAEIVKDLFSCKTISDLIELQSKVFQANTVSTLNEATKFIDTAMACSKDIAEPLAKCMSHNMECAAKSQKQHN
jgi:phasin family protein